MKKFTKFISCITAAVLTLGIAGCTKTDKTVYPDFVNGTEQDAPPVQASEKYVINVLSEGGMRLDGVRVFAKRGGEIVKRVISNNGRIDLAVSLGEYDLEVDETTLPAGYYLDGKTYKTNPEARDEVTIRIPSKLLGANEKCGYRVGDIMKDFTFKDYNGTDYRLSELLKTKKAVLLNFWYVNCTYCRQEFPALQKAYANTSDIEVLAINPMDDAEKGKGYQDQEKLTFPMGEDRLGLSSSFNVTGYPTTVAIDRYGMITMIHASGEPDMTYWSNLFSTLASPDYVQDVTTGGEEGGEQSRPDAVKPTVSMPASSVLEKAANGANANGTTFKATYTAEKDEYAWPWVAGEDDAGSTYISSTNKGYGDSYSMVNATFDMKEGDVLSFEYNVDSEKGNDVLLVQVDGIIMNGEGWSATDGWKTSNLYVADYDKEVTLTFTFMKDAADPEGFNKADVALVRNIHLADKSVITEPVDIFRTCAEGLKEDGSSTKYDHYVDAVYSDPAQGGDGFYHKGTADGSIIYMAISNLTPWSELHTGNSTQMENGTTYYNTLYNMTYYNYAQTGENFSVKIGNTDITDTLVTYWMLQSYMPAPYYLLPVNEKLKEWADLFVADFEDDKGLTAHEDEWLEFCYYYDHVSATNDYTHAEGEVCEAKIDRTRGLTRFNSFTAYEKHDTEALAANPEMHKGDGKFLAKMDYPMQPINGVYFKFTSKEAGVYKIRSYEGSEGAVPGLRIHSADGKFMEMASRAPRDHAAVKGTEQYSGFNHYLTLEANTTVYLMPTTAGGATGSFEFDIEYLGTSYKKMLIASTDDGMWGGESGNVYLGIDVVYDQDDDLYYKRAENGDPIKDQPIYIDMIYGSCMYSDIPGSTGQSVEWLVEGKYFETLKNGNVYQGIMEKCLADAKATSLPESDAKYGLVPATAKIVNTLNMLIDKYVDGGMGDGRGWLMFACYEEHFGF